MFTSPACTWCDLWEEEVGIVYEKTDEGRNLPLRRVDIHDERPTDLEKLRTVMFTPTFVLLNNGNEIGRITGYSGEDHFWGLMDELIVKMEAAIQGCRHVQQLAQGRATPTSAINTC
ncbi:MAG TPA: thioredoxin family protein [Rhodospirillales bacterium]|nr:thioredoxin family protein [Rhodospirillales bacterium]